MAVCGAKKFSWRFIRGWLLNFEQMIIYEQKPRILPKKQLDPDSKICIIAIKKSKLIKLQDNNLFQKLYIFEAIWLGKTIPFFKYSKNCHF